MSNGDKIDDKLYLFGSPYLLSNSDSNSSQAMMLDEDRPVMRAMAMPDGPQLLESIPSIGRRGNHKLDDAILNVSFTNKIISTEYEDVVTRSNWNVQDCCLSPLPVYHPLECTHCIVSVSHASPQLIAARISDACAQMSLAALYNDKRGVAQLFSSDFCEMIVRLYASNLDSGELNATIVEVQRRKGNALSFHQYARKLLGAAQGSEDLDLDDVIKTAPPLPAEIFDKIIDVEERENAIAALLIAGNLLKKDRMDANQLGMESLCLLTDPTKTGTKTATIVSRAILTGSTKPVSPCALSSMQHKAESFEEEDALLHNLSFRKTILSLIQFKKLSDDDDDPPVSDLELSEPDNLVDDEDSVDGQQRRSFEAEHADALHNLALAVLANSLEMIAKDGSLCDMIDQQQWLGDAALVKTLLDILRRAEKKPHDAMLSARCLSSLVDASTKAIEHAMQLGAISIVMQAKNIGRKRHLSLARESNNVYEALRHNM